MRLDGRLKKLRQAVDSLPASGEIVQRYMARYDETGELPEGDSPAASLARQILEALEQMVSSVPGASDGLKVDFSINDDDYVDCVDDDDDDDELR